MPRERIRIMGGAEVKKLKRGGWAARYRIPAHGDEPESRSPWRKIPDATGKKDAKRKAAVRIAISCGFRMGECLGLQWQDVHLEESDAYISLRRQLNRDGELVYLKYNGIGDIPIDDDTVQWLWEWKSVVERESGKSDAETRVPAS